jgi:hypothetical protein
MVLLRFVEEKKKSGENMSLIIISTKKIIMYTKLEYDQIGKSQRNLIMEIQNNT